MLSPYAPVTTGMPYVAPSVPPLRPMQNCLSCPKVAAPVYTPRLNAAAMPAATGAPGAPAITLAGGVATRPATPAHRIAATVTTDASTTAAKPSGGCGCGSGMKWWEIGLMILGGLAVLRAVAR